MDVSAIFGREKRLETQAFFEADDAVLNGQGAAARKAGHDEEDDGHRDPPEMESPMLRPMVDGDIDGEDEVEQEHGQHEEVKGRVEACMVLEGLRGWHWNPL